MIIILLHIYLYYLGENRTKSKILILITLGILFALSSLVYNNLNFKTENGDRSSEYGEDITGETKNLKISKVSGKIRIDGNSGWADAKTAGTCTGSGTFSDPYIIEDLVIDGGFSGRCISIDFSNVYFKIENCTLYNSGLKWGDAGIILDAEVSNGQVINNTVYNSYNGIFLGTTNNINISRNILSNNDGVGIQSWHSTNNLILSNTIFSNNQGIVLFDSSSNTISGNEIDSNVHVGITLSDGSNNNEVLENVCNNHGGGGIDIISSNRNKISSNTITNNKGFGIILDEDSMCNEVSNNYFSGNPEDIQDNQLECPLPLEIVLAIVIPIVIITIVVTGIIIRKRRASKYEVARYYKLKEQEMQVMDGSDEILIPQKLKVEAAKDVGPEELVVLSSPEEIISKEKDDVQEAKEEDQEVVEPLSFITEEDIANVKKARKEKISLLKPSIPVKIEAPQPKMLSCVFCGMEVDAERNYCQLCGHKLKKK